MNYIEANYTKMFSAKGIVFGTILVLLLLKSPIVYSQQKYYIQDFGVTPSEKIDATEGITKALNECKLHPGCTLYFEKGEYHFWGDKASEKYQFISNNDEGLKRIIFNLEGFNNFTIDGQGARFIFHGFVNPFVIENSTSITLKNFSIDFYRPFHSEGIILNSDQEGVMDLLIPEQYPYKIVNDILLFTDKAYHPTNNHKTTVSKESYYSYGSLLEFDTNKKETAFMAKDYYINSIPLIAKQLEKNKIRIYLKGLKGTIGNTLVFAPGHRNHPGFVITNSDNITCNNLTIYHSGGMGIIGQRSNDIYIKNCKVQPSEGRMISCTADATHFVNCTGTIELGNSTFMNQMDDATNIHGIYAQINEILSPTKFYVRLKHPQQFGFDFLANGTEIEFVQGKSLITFGESKIISVTRLNKEITFVEIDKPMPSNTKVGDVISSTKQLTNIHIHHNYIGKNRARGMLLNTRGKIIVEHNTFHSPGAAILFEGDANHWFEQGGVRNCIIRNNLFDNCLFGNWGKAIIDVAAGILENKEKSRYNKNIKVYNNTFRIFNNTCLLHAYGVENLSWKDNKIEYTKDYPSSPNQKKKFELEYCNKIDIVQDDFRYSNP